VSKLSIIFVLRTKKNKMLLSPLSLRAKYKHYFSDIRSGSILKIFVFLHCILSSRTVCLYKCRDKIAGDSKKEAKYALLIRLFKLPNLEKVVSGISLLIVDLLFPKEATIHLVMDRTNWKFGNCHMNVLVLGFLFHKNSIFIPLVWTDLGEKRKRGNSNYEDRKNLIDKFLNLVGTNTSRFVLVADREFLGTDFWAYLTAKGLHFVIRIRQFTYLELCSQCFNLSKKEVIFWIQQEVTRNGKFVFDLPFGGKFYRVVVVKNNQKYPKKGNEYLFLLSDLKQENEILAYYTFRWKIECCFRHMKSNGFNLEEIHFKDQQKIDCIFAMATLAYIFAIQEAIIDLETIGLAIPLKRYTDKIEKTVKEYPEISLFRYGYEIIQNQQRNTMLTIFIQQNKDKIITIEGKKYRITEISV
jgi:hypothetical protein